MEDCSMLEEYEWDVSEEGARERNKPPLGVALPHACEVDILHSAEN